MNLYMIVNSHLYYNEVYKFFSYESSQLLLFIFNIIFLFLINNTKYDTFFLGINE
jgi:hypothetical protein